MFMYNPNVYRTCILPYCHCNKRSAYKHKGMNWYNINSIAAADICLYYLHVPPPYGRTSRVWDFLLVMKSGCSGGRGFAPRPGQ